MRKLCLLLMTLLATSSVWGTYYVKLYAEKVNNWAVQEQSSETDGVVKFESVALGNGLFNINVWGTGYDSDDKLEWPYSGITVGTPMTAQASGNRDLTVNNAQSNDVFDLEYNIKTKTLTVTKPSSGESGGETTTDKYYLIHGQIFGNSSWSDDTTGKTLSSNGVWTITVNATAEGNFGIKDLGTTGEKQENWLNYNSFTYADGATNYVGSADDSNIKLKSKGEYTISIDFNKTKPVFSITPKNETPVTPTYPTGMSLAGSEWDNNWSYSTASGRKFETTGNGIFTIENATINTGWMTFVDQDSNRYTTNSSTNEDGELNISTLPSTVNFYKSTDNEKSIDNKTKIENVDITINFTTSPATITFKAHGAQESSYKVLVGYSDSWSPTERGEIKDGVWTWTMPANTNGGVSIYLEKNGAQESYGQDNYNNGETKVLDSSKNYVYFAKNVPVKLSLDLATLKLTATWEEGTVTTEDRYFRIHGKIINGSEWTDGDLSKSSNNVWSTTGDFKKGEFGIKICGEDGNQLKVDGISNSFWIGGVGHTGTSTTLTDKAKNYIKDSGSNFNLLADGKYTFTLTQLTPTTFTLDVETEVETPEVEKTYTVYFVNKGNWSDVHVWAYTNLSKYPEGHENAGQDIPEAQKNNVLSGQDDAYKYAPSIKADRAKGLETLIEGDYEVYKYIITNELWQQLIFYRNSGDNITNGKTRNLFVVDGGVYFPDDELLPSNIYDTSLPEHQRFQAYPTATKSTDYNVIYIDVPEFGYNRNEVKIDITYERDGVKYEATGKPRTTLLEPVTIAGKQFLRLELTEAVIPNGTNMNLNVYINGCSDDPHNDDEHHGCSDPKRPLVYSNIVYADGNVYSRGETKHIRDLVKPVDFYLVPMSENFKLSDESVTPVTLTDVEEGNEINAFRFVAKEEEGKLIYRTTNVPVKEKFTFLARFENTDSEGNKTSLYSWFSNEKDLDITRGNWYDIDINNKNTFSILQRSPSITHYQLTVNWNDQRINVLPVKNSANFALAVATNGGFVRDYDGFAVVNAVADKAEDYETFTISHNADLTADELQNITVSMSRKSTYNKYFGSENPKNQPAKTHPDHGYQVIDESKANGFELGTVKAKAHTAGVCLVVIKHVPADQTENGDFDASTYQFPVRVRPTLQSIDLVTNHMTHLISGDNGIELQYTTDGSMDHTDDNGMVWTVERPRFNAYMAEETSDLELWWKYSDGTAEEDPAENEVNTLPAFRGEAANTIVAAAESALTVDTETLEHPSTQGYTKYDRNSTPNLTKAVNGLDFVVKQNGILGEPQHVIVKEVQALSPTEVDEIESADEVEAVYYDLNGVRVNGDNLAKGLYIVVKGNTAEKIYVK